MQLKIIDAGPDRDAYLSLLLLADESEQQVRGYLADGTLFVAQADGEDIGLVLAIPLNEVEVELRAVAIVPNYQNQGMGQQMLGLVLEYLGTMGFGRVVVGTGNSGIGQLAFYQKAGFRFWKIERDFFSTARGYPDDIEENGIPLRDMVWLDCLI